MKQKKTKQKTSNLTAKRLKITGRGKVMHRPINQDHFNAKEEGQRKRTKKKQRIVKINKLRRLLPYINKKHA